MAKYAEPLGTDQGGTLFWGLWLHRELADESTKEEIDEMNIRTLEWYRKQDYSYLYYKIFVHGSRGDNMRDLGHSLTHYLPCLLWAREVSGEKKYYDDYVKLWEEQWYECSGKKMFSSWKHRFLLRWLTELAPEKDFWRKFYERCIDADVETFRGEFDYRDERESLEWHSAPIEDNGLSYEWPDATNPDFKPGLIWEEKDWFPGWRTASHEQKAQLVRAVSVDRMRNIMKGNGWWPGEKRSAYKHKAQFIPVSKIKDITMYALYDNSAIECLEKAREYLAKYDSIDFYTIVIDPDHTLIAEKDIQFQARSICSGFLSCWLMAYWMLKRLESQGQKGVNR